ncbi:dithiol-disulfide isomerase [Pseudonocardia sp. K10HN5]|uniref:Dithiol-disulfide isomerase n=2 Tax=Pseudonocardia acidicola TaxID=2724939 RepID=A0ABX1SHG1_9PSEU|nr:dithiol-disulfide isomerase [Pseudonocardia acidicola]NMI01001.1 dithiol-disulfide isomerase [Pseudonocardia acidicola]
MNQDRTTVTVWSDIGCPWATLALAILRRRADQRGQALLIDHRAFPLELFNRRPTPKPIVDAEVVAIAGCRPELGWKPWTAPDHTYAVTTLPAMEAVQACKDPEIGGLRGSDEFDSALRKAFYVDGRCISVHAVILDVAQRCEHVDADRLESALAQGIGRRDVFDQWRIAQRPEIEGSPQIFTAYGAFHNPGAAYHWTAAPPAGFPRLESYTLDWAEGLLEVMAHGDNASGL